MSSKPDSQRIVLTGVGLTSPNANCLQEFRQALLEGKSGVSTMEMRYFGSAPAGLCDFDATLYQKRRDLPTAPAPAPSQSTARVNASPPPESTSRQSTPRAWAYSWESRNTETSRRKTKSTRSASTTTTQPSGATTTIQGLSPTPRPGKSQYGSESRGRTTRSAPHARRETWAS